MTVLGFDLEVAHTHSQCVNHGVVKTMDLGGRET